ncbi:MAG TPA: LLM class flavin-dependent oxidoreductase [Candidatus Limnocylindrales bacterium]|nr:LLM class flavin-dependent oxidoreductase [Candidatus Limnocylindrales bacterium]
MRSQGLRIGFQVWSQYATWDELMAAGQAIDELGFDELWSNDHLLPPPGLLDVPGRGPIFEGWSVLFGWSARTQQVRSGCLVSGAAYRHPALVVKMATALDHATHGRAALGLGAGWFEAEHRAFGFAFGTVRERLDRLSEAAAICRAMLDGRPALLQGGWYSADGARNDPPPVQRRLPLVIGGSGARRTLAIVAREADVWNADGDDVDEFRRLSAVLDDHCRAIGRAPAAIERTIGLPAPCIRASRAASVAALAMTFRHHGLTRVQADRAARRSPFADTAPAVAERLCAYRDAGAGAVMFDWPGPFDRPTLEALAGPVRDVLDEPRGQEVDSCRSGDDTMRKRLRKGDEEAQRRGVDGR